MPDDVPTYKALNCRINLSLGRPPSSQWRRRPGRPRSRWVNQLRTDNNIPPADLWRRAVHPWSQRGDVRNGLPHDIVASDTLSHFRRGLKTLLFRQSYPSILF